MANNLSNVLYFKQNYGVFLKKRDNLYSIYIFRKFKHRKKIKSLEKFRDIKNGKFSKKFRIKNRSLERKY